MTRYKAKTTATANSVSDFLDAVPDVQRKKDAFAIMEIMKKQSGFEPKMWGPAIVGFGSYHYKYESGHEGDAPLIGFSPRKAEFALYLATNFDGKEALLKQFGKHKTGKACIYIKKLADINIEVLKKMITSSITFFTER
ncbi:DUF1801 domain-containing protein [Agriterribacter sp.]|uniref:DUF1801 domain-containing protein n=1 Tax=Agriterribacter sp. TaxID=2821509 RepID=UPI002D105603|nr:DUF1801 domain-containing protein [Agriterribacter sp.]HRO48371.1 DUF1801 domain-containing protein [Agriterribacter sp.]HRQ19378.1 DUF1801 domain-containing protein [Agriterribacter sp.]